MTSFTEGGLHKRLKDLNTSQQSIQTLSLWLIHHRKYAHTVVKIWSKELLSGNLFGKLFICQFHSFELNIFFIWVFLFFFSVLNIGVVSLPHAVFKQMKYLVYLVMISCIVIVVTNNCSLILEQTLELTCVYSQLHISHIRAGTYIVVIRGLKLIRF